MKKKKKEAKELRWACGGSRRVRTWQTLVNLEYRHTAGSHYLEVEKNQKARHFSKNQNATYSPRNIYTFIKFTSRFQKIKLS
jgi:hypothetical protein